MFCLVSNCLLSCFTCFDLIWVFGLGFLGGYFWEGIFYLFFWKKNRCSGSKEV